MYSRLALRAFGAQVKEFKVGLEPAPNKPVHAKRHLEVLCAFWSLLRDFRRSAADRFVRADARPNRVGGRPLAEIKSRPEGEERPASGHGRNLILIIFSA